MQNDRQSSETVILGVDTHLDIHVGAVISQAGKLLGTHIIQTNQAGYLELLDWARSFGILERAGIEGTGTYGAALTRYLMNHGSLAAANRGVAEYDYSEYPYRMSPHVTQPGAPESSHQNGERGSESRSQSQ
ncbi:hypothetical protein NEL96_24615 [Escherichia coli]|nr:transposase [Escherichia coli]AOM58093.1 hypothetical protein BCV59_27180 [Escherichia coli]AOM63150.1 hypothetical protein CFSAN004177_27545 [Escherichia coli]MDI1005056.1 hypothetical protein [Escherichia coli]MDI1082959.1 hypothetical protein [Escherichia coli]